MDSNQSSAEEDSCSSDTEDKISKPPKKIRKLTIEEPVVPVEANVAAVDSSDDNCSESSDTEVTGPPVKIPKLDESATPWKESRSKLISDLISQQPSASTYTAHEGEQVRSYM